MPSSRSDVLTVRALTVALRGWTDPRVDADDVVAAAEGHEPVLARALARVCGSRLERLGPTADRAATLLRAALHRMAERPFPINHLP